MEEIKQYISELKSKYNLADIQHLLNNLGNLSVLIIGDTIIDHYVFVSPKGRSVKDPILSVEYHNREVYPGGVLAVANHLGEFVKNIKLVTLLGDHDSHLNFIKNSLKQNIELKPFIKKDSPTTVKKRMVNNYRKNKLFKIEYINDEPIEEPLSHEISQFLELEIPKYDLVIVSDFGHGFINNQIRKVIEKKSKFLSINVQSNSANMGYNYFNLYEKFNFITMNNEELRLPLSRRFDSTNEVIREAINKFNINNFLLTQGKGGCLFVKNNTIHHAPILTKTVKDTVGAGDALFAISTLLVYSKAPEKIVPFIANCAGGLASNVMGNKESLSKEKLMDFIRNIYEEK